MSEPSTISAATIGNAADDGSAGTTTSAPCSSGWPVSAILRPWLPSVVETISRAKMLQHQLGVVAAGFLLDHGGDARRGKPRQQHRRFDLRRGHRRPVEDRHGIARAVQRQRQAAAFPALAGLGAHQFQGIEDPPHRPAAQRGVAVEYRRDRAAGDRPHHQPAAGAGIAEIERGCGLREARHPDARAPTRRNRPVRSTLAPSACIDLAVLRTSSPSSRPEILVSPTASAPRIRARCEIDLSPGTRTLPVRGPLDAGFQRGSGGRNGSRLCPLRRGRQVSHGPHGVTRPSNARKAAIDSGALN